MRDLGDADPRDIGPYHLVARIGAGGMGVVYLAKDATGNQVAVKLVRAELADDPGFRARFRREVEAGQRVGGICTAKYLDADVVSERPYLVTEYVAGGNLADRVSTEGPLVGDQLVGLAVGLAEAIVAMHAAGVIHRDLKPSNVLLAPHGPKVFDFGISHAADATSLTQTGIVVGSPAWMAPEQARTGEATPAVDVFSWGATVAFAATGRSPFGEGRPDAVIYRVVHESPDLNGVPPKLYDLVARALQKDPAARPHPDELLVGVVKTAMVGALPPGGSVDMATAILDRTWKQEVPTAARPTRLRLYAWLAAVAVIVVALVAGIAFVTARSPSSHQAANTAVDHRTGTTTPATTAVTTSTTAVPSGASSPTALTSANLPVVACSTTYGGPTPNNAQLPPSLAESVPADLAGQLAVYTDEQGLMDLLGPRGWACSANFGADGSGGVQVYPAGETLSSGALSQGSTEQAIVGSQTSACFGCRVDQACPLFASAATDEQNNYGTPCPTTRPPTETVETISSGVVGFSDPPDVAGDGNPSGGAYPADGVMTYQSGKDSNGSWLDTCTLPDNEQQLCTAVLNDFVTSYGAN